jgi:3-oxoacyl-[acyl-carrier protein] reductase
MSNVSQRVAIVTGGSGGIGSTAARRLAADGFAVVVHYAGKPAPAEETVKKIRATGGLATAFQADVAEESEARALFQHAEDEYSHVDVVVHTAGIMPLAPITAMDLETFDRVVRTNLRGTFVVDRLAAQHVRAGGAIINFSTSVTRLQIPAYGAYAASKGGVEALPLILARELRGRDITVNAVAPGPTATPLFFEGKSQEAIDNLAMANPMERLGTAKDVSEVVAFLAGPGRWVHGQVVYTNGGMA